MKLIAIILAIITLFLSIQPVLIHQSPVPQGQANKPVKCCSEEKYDCESAHNDTQPQKDEQNKCCNNGFCNPFEVCACCSLIANDAPLVYLSEFLPFALREKVTLTNDKILSLYVQDFWQPPEIVSYT